MSCFSTWTKPSTEASSSSAPSLLQPTSCFSTWTKPSSSQVSSPPAPTHLRPTACSSAWSSLHSGEMLQAQLFWTFSSGGRQSISVWHNIGRTSHELEQSQLAQPQGDGGVIDAVDEVGQGGGLHMWGTRWGRAGSSTGGARHHVGSTPILWKLGGKQKNH